MKLNNEINFLDTKENITANIFCISIIFLYLILTFYLIPLDELFTKTIPTGGDHPGHFFKLHQTNLTQKFSFWNPYNLAGEIQNTHYFPITTLTGVILSKIIHETTAYKIITLCLTYLLPYLVFYALYKKRKNLLDATIGFVLFTIVYFNLNNIQWGLSASSTLIGLTSHSMALVFFILLCLRLSTIKSFNSHDLPTTLFVSLVCLSHPYIAINIPIVFVALFLINKDNKKDFIFFTLKSLVFSILLCLWWLIPFFINYSSNSSFSFRGFDVLHAFGLLSISQIIYLSVFSIITAYSFFNQRSIKESFPIFLLLLANIFFLFLFPLINLVDIRVIGMIFFLLYFLFYQAITAISFSKKLILLIILGISFIPLHLKEIEQIKKLTHNFLSNPLSKNASFELESIINSLKKADVINDSRMIYEFYPPIQWKFGSDRFFEILPLFTNKPIALGLYYQSNKFSKQAHYFQSLIGADNQCAPNDPCSNTIDLKKASELMPVLGIDTILLFSQKSQQEAIFAKHLFDGYIKLPFATLLTKKIPALLTTKDDCIVNLNVDINQLNFTTSCPNQEHILKFMHSPLLVSSDTLIKKGPHDQMIITPFKNKGSIDMNQRVLFYSKMFSLLTLISLVGFCAFRSSSSFLKRSFSSL